MRVGWGAGNLFFFSFLWVWILSFPGVWTFPWVHSFFSMSLAKSAKFVESGKPTGSAIITQGLAIQQIVWWWEKIILCIVYFTYSLLLLLIIVSLHIYFVFLINCLYLNPRVLPFVLFSSPPHWGEREEGASSCFSA